MPEHEWVSSIDVPRGVWVRCDVCDGTWRPAGPHKHETTCPIPVLLELEGKQVSPDDDLREALDQASIALGVVLAQQETGHDPGTYLLVDRAFERASEAIKGSQPRFPESPTRGIVRGRRRCPVCGLRAYRWGPAPSGPRTLLRCLGCRHPHGLPQDAR